MKVTQIEAAIQRCRSCSQMAYGYLAYSYALITGRNPATIIRADTAVVATLSNHPTIEQFQSFVRAGVLERVPPEMIIAGGTAAHYFLLAARYYGDALTRYSEGGAGATLEIAAKQFEANGMLWLARAEQYVPENASLVQRGPANPAENPDLLRAAMRFVLETYVKLDWEI